MGDQEPLMGDEGDEAEMDEYERELEPGMSMAELEDSKADDESRKNLLMGLAAAVIMELALCTLSHLTFAWEREKILWIIFGSFFSIRAFIFCGAACMESDVMASLILIFSCLPFMPYAVLIGGGAVTDCDIVEESKTLKTWSTGKIETFTDDKLACASQDSWIPIQLVNYIPLLFDFGSPLVFSFVFIQGGRALNINMRDSKTKLQLAILDFADLAAFATIPFTITGNVFFRSNAYWFTTLRFWLVLGCAAACAEVALGLLEPFKRKLKEMEDSTTSCIVTYMSKDATYAAVSLICIDLPMLILRGYFFWCGIEVTPIFMVKNVLCGLYEFGEVFGIKCLTKNIAKLLDFLPNSDAAKAQAEKSEQLLKMTVGERAAQKEANANAKATYSKRVRSLLDMTEIIDEKMLKPGDVQEDGKIRERIGKAMETFDEDEGGSISFQELRGAFELLARQAEAERFIKYVQEKEKDHADHDEVPRVENECANIGDMTDYFLDWRIHEDYEAVPPKEKELVEEDKDVDLAEVVTDTDEDKTEAEDEVEDTNGDEADEPDEYDEIDEGEGEYDEDKVKEG